MITSTLPPGIDRVEETVVKYVASEPITFEQFQELFLGSKDFVELVNGCVVEKTMVGWDHEELLGWITTVAYIFVEEQKLGVIAGSRTAVRISPLGSRLPDFFFVAKDRLNIVQQNAVLGPPDLVIEIRSPSTSASEIVALESDYRSIGVPEIVFIDPVRRHVRANRLRDGVYIPEEQDHGILRLQSVPGLWFDVRWLFDRPRPSIREVLALIEQGPAGS